MTDEEKQIKGLTGAQRAAMLVMSIEDDQAASLLRNMSERSLSKLRQAADSLDVAQIGPDEKRATLLWFLRKQQGGEFFLGAAGERFRRTLIKAKGIEGAERIYQETLSEERAAQAEDEGAEGAEGEQGDAGAAGTYEAREGEKAEAQIQTDREAFEAIQKVPEQRLAKLVKDESPRCIAVLMSVLPNEKSGRLLGLLDSNVRKDVVRALIGMENLPREVIDEVVRGFSEKTQQTSAEMVVLSEEERVTKLAEMLTDFDRDSREEILKGVRDENPEMAAKIERSIFAFDDLIKVDAKSIQRLLGKVEPRTIAISIKGATDELQNYILENLSQRVREIVEEERVRVGRVQPAWAAEEREKIMDEAREMEAAHELEFKLEEGDEYVE